MPHIGYALSELVAEAHLRWPIERDYQDLKQELGSDHYEGRGWRGFHHHASLTIAAYGFLVSGRFAAGKTAGAKKNFLERQMPALPADYVPRGAPARTAPSIVIGDPVPKYGEDNGWGLACCRIPAAAIREGQTMIKLLSAIGRATIVIAAALVILGFGMFGFLGSYFGEYKGAFANDVGIGFNHVLSALIGNVAGILLTGAIFGPFATLYDIRDNLPRLIRFAESAPAPSHREYGDRAEPTLERQEPGLR